MRVAVLLSGHMRSYLKCFKHLYANIIHPYGADVFLHTWDELNVGVPLDVEDRLAIMHLYEPTDICIDSQNGRDDLVMDRIRPWCHSVRMYCKPMFYSVQQANEMRKRHERERGFLYDVVIRCRPDITIKQKLDLTDFDPAVLYVPDLSGGGANDIFAYGSGPVMDVYSGVFPHIDEYVATRECCHAEGVLLKHLRVNLLPICFCKTVLEIVR